VFLGYCGKAVSLQLYYPRSLSARDVKYNDSSSF
jgi:hypothetical protein